MKLKHLLLAFLIFFLLFSFLASVVVLVEATGANWLTGWTYRRSLLIKSATGAGTNYQVRIIVKNGTSEGASTTFVTNDTITVNNKTNADFGDVSFSDDTGNGGLSYWMETLNSGLNATFWVKVTADLSSVSQTIYVYYGKSGATTTSDGIQTFVMFDDFPGASLNATLWTADWSFGVGGTVSVANSILNITDNTGTYAGKAIKSAAAYTVPYAFRCSAIIASTATLYAGMYKSTNTNPTTGKEQFAIFRYDGVQGTTEADGSTSTLKSVAWTAANYNTFEVQRNSSGYNDFYINNVLKNNDHAKNSTLDTIARFAAYGSGITILSDWALIRKFTSSEPAFSTWGSEETSGDSTPPTYSSISGNTTLANNPCSFNCLVSDDTNVSTYIFSTNNTGTWTNDSATTFSDFFNTTAAWANVTKTLNDAVGNVVSYLWYANDTSNNWSKTEQYNFTLTAPYRPSLQMTPDNVTCRKYLETFSIQINVTNAIDTKAFNFTIYYDPLVLNYSGVSWGELGTGTMTEIDTTNGILEGNVADSPITGNHWLLNITFEADKTIIWKDGLTNKLEGKIWFHQAQLGFTDNSTLQYVEGGINQIDVNQAAYTFLPIQGDVNNDGTVDVLDLRLVAFYYDKTPADPQWPEASKYDLNRDNTIDIFDLIIVASNFGFTYS